MNAVLRELLESRFHGDELSAELVDQEAGKRNTVTRPVEPAVPAKVSLDGWFDEEQPEERHAVTPPATGRDLAEGFTGPDFVGGRMKPKR